MEAEIPTNQRGPMSTMVDTRLPHSLTGRQPKPTCPERNRRNGRRSRRESESTTQKTMCPFEDGSVEAGLWALSQVAEPGERFSLHAIAHACGYSHEQVRKIEIKALAKVRF